MIPPCAIANWLHGLHGEAFEKVDYFCFPFLHESQIFGWVLLFPGQIPGTRVVSWLWRVASTRALLWVDHLFWPTLRELRGRTWPCAVWLVAWDLIRICCVDITPLVVLLPLLLVRAFAVLQFCSILGAGPYSVITSVIWLWHAFALDFGLSLRCDGLSLLGWHLVFTPTILGCSMWPHRATLPV